MIRSLFGKEYKKIINVSDYFFDHLYEIFMYGQLLEKGGVSTLPFSFLTNNSVGTTNTNKSPLYYSSDLARPTVFYWD